MRVAAAGEELFRQRNERNPFANCLPRAIQRTGAWRDDSGASIGLLQADTGGTGEDVLMPRLAFAPKRIVGGMLKQGAAEVGLRSEVGGRSKCIQREVGSFRALQRVVALVVDKREAGPSYACGKREQSDFAGVKAFREVTRFN